MCIKSLEKTQCKVCGEVFKDKRILNHIAEHHKNEMFGNMKKFQINKQQALILMINYLEG